MTEQRLEYRDIPLGVFGGRRRVDGSGGFFPTTAELRPRPVYEAVTRVYNVLAAVLGLLVLSPLLLCLAVAVRSTSPGPVFYRGARVGRGERIFQILKFRTMQIDAEQRIGKRLVNQDDDVYTPVGRFLRKYRLDELPQLLNVLRGDMNLVGPRPVRPIFLEDHKAKIPGYALRFSVRPGITGQAQVRGGYYTRPRHKLFYEVVYILNRSVWLDLSLIVLTFLRVMTRIFTTGMLLAWLLLMALALPAEIQRDLTIGIGRVHFSAAYLLPPLIALAHILRREVTTGRISALRTPVDVVLIGFLIVPALLIPFADKPIIALRGVLWYACNGVVVFYIVLNSRLVTDRRTHLIGALVGSAALGGLIATASTVLPFLAGEGWTRPSGSAGNPQLLSGLMMLAVPLAMARIRRARSGRVRGLYVGALFVLGSTALLSFSRVGLLCMAIAAGIYLWHVRPRYALMLATGLAALVLVLGLSGDSRLTPGGLEDWAAETGRRQAAVAQDVGPVRMVLGLGSRSLPPALEAVRGGPTRDAWFGNNFLTLLAEHGAIGLLLFVLFLWRVMRLAYRAGPRVPDPVARDDIRAAAAGLVAFVVMMAFSDPLTAFPMMIVFWSLAGLAVGTTLHYLPGPKTVYRLIHYRDKL